MVLRDPNDAQFIGPIKVNDGLELILGMTMSCIAIIISGYIGSGEYGGGVIDWGNWRCNLCSCILTVLAYATSYVSPELVKNIVVSKFVASFCGSLSGFSATASRSMVWYFVCVCSGIYRS